MSARDFLTTEPRGRAYVRALITRQAGALASESALNFATQRWGAGAAQAVAKAVDAITSGDVAGDSAAREFLSLVSEQSIIGRLAGLRRVPFRTRMLAVTAGATGYWVSEAAPKPVSGITLAGSSLEPLKVASIVVVTKEALDSQDDLAEHVLQADLTRAVTATLDQALLDAMNGGVPGQVPASVTHGAPTIAASGDLAADLAALVSAFQGDLASAYFVCSPTVATRLATATDAGGRYSFPGIGPRGGSLLGIPVLTSRHSLGDSNGGTLALVDPAGIVANLSTIWMDTAAHTSLQMESTPDDPGDGETVMVSLWQRNLVAFRTEIRANWRAERSGCVAVLAGV